MRSYSEILQICTTATTKDSAGGNKKGAESVIDTVQVSLKEKPLKRSDESGKLVFYKMFEFDLWVNPAYTLTVANYFKYKGGVLKIHSLTLSDLNRKYNVITEGIL